MRATSKYFRQVGNSIETYFPDISGYTFNGLLFARHPLPIIHKTVPIGQSASTLTNGVVIFDWLGTLSNECSIWAAKNFQDAFKHLGLNVTMEEARGPMGLKKQEHAEILLFKTPRILEQFRKVYNRNPNGQDIARLLKLYEGGDVSGYDQLLPGLVSTQHFIKYVLGFKMGMTTGFDRVVANKFIHPALQQGLLLDSSATSDEVKRGRPFPDGIVKNLRELGLATGIEHAAKTLIKVDDTCVGIEEGRQAGAWTVGVYGTGSYMNVNSLEQIKEMDQDEWILRALNSMSKLSNAHPNFLVPSVNYLPGVIHFINLLKAQKIGQERVSCMSALEILKSSTNFKNFKNCFTKV